MVRLLTLPKPDLLPNSKINKKAPVVGPNELVQVKSNDETSGQSAASSSKQEHYMVCA